MPGSPTFTCFRDSSGGAVPGASVSGKSITVTDGNEKFEFNENISGKALADTDAVLGNGIVEAALAGKNVNIIALNGQDFLFQDAGTKAGIVHHLVDKVFSGVANARVQVTMADFKRNKASDLLAAKPGADITVNSKDGERVPVIEGAIKAAVGSAGEAVGLINAALLKRASSLAQGGLHQVVHTILQVHVSQISDSTQKTAVLSFVNVEMGTDETALHFAAMARDYGAGSKKLKAHDNLLLQALRTSLGGNAHSFAVGELRADASAAANEMLVKTLAALGKVKDAAAAREFKADPELSDDKKWKAAVAATADVARALCPSEVVADYEKRSSEPHLIGLHTDHLANERTFIPVREGSKRVGRADAKVVQDIVLNGLGIQTQHCTIARSADKCSITPADSAEVLVNGEKCAAGKAKELSHNDRVRLGAFQTFRFVMPGSVGSADAQFNIQYAENEIREASKASHGAGISDGNIDASQQETIGRLLPMVNEANNISEELKRGINFMLKMVAKQGKGGTGSDVQVQVTYSNGDEALWDADTFLDRVYEMRDIYDQFISRGRDLMYVNNKFTGAADPFAKKSDEAVVGRAMIYLDAVNHLLAVHETTPIIDYKGFTRGELKVELDLQLPNVADKDAAAKFDELERVENLKGKQLRVNLKVVGIRGLPSNFCEDAYVSFRFFLDDKPNSTPKQSNKTINPKFNYEKAWNLVVTDELCSYLASDVLEFIVYAKSSGGDPVGGGGGKDAAGPEHIDDDAMQQLQEKEEELQELKLQLSEQKVEMERKLRAKAGGGGGGESKLSESSEDVEDLKDHIDFLEQKIESLEAQKKQLEVTIAERDNDLQEAQNQLDDDEETMQQQLTKIQELEQELAAAKKSKACVIL